MAERCPICGRTPGQQPLNRPTPGELFCGVEGSETCVRNGFERVSAQLTSTKAQLDRAQLLLIKSRDAIDLAIAETQQRPDEGSEG